jgi:hypothetical protein
MDILRSALSLVIHRGGKVSIRDITSLIKRYRSKRGIEIDQDEYVRAIKTSTEYYHQERARVFICTDRPCAKRSIFEISEDCLDSLSAKIGCSVITTGCHWQCDDAPVITLKVGDKTKHYLKCETQARRDQVLESIRDLVACDKAKQEKKPCQTDGEEKCLIG